MSPPRLHPSTDRAFSLVELLIVIAVIAIMASLVISAFSNAASDTRSVIVRQQQAVLQEAVNSWVAHEGSGTTANGKKKTLSSALTIYNGKANTKARLLLIGQYLDGYAAADADMTGTYKEFYDNSTDSQIRSSAMIKTGNHLELPAWTAGSYPKVQLVQPE